MPGADLPAGVLDEGLAPAGVAAGRVLALAAAEPPTGVDDDEDEGGKAAASFVRCLGLRWPSCKTGG